MNVKELLHEYDSLLSRAHWGVGTKRHEVSYSEWATIFLGNNNAPLVGTSRPDDTDMFTSPRPITFEYDEDGPRQILDLMRQSMTGEIVDPELCAHRHFVKSWLDDTIFAHEVHDLQPFIYHGLMRTCNRLTKRNLPYFNTCNSPADAHAEFKYLECHNFKPGRLMKITAYRQFYQTIKRMYPDPVRRDSSLPARSSDPSKRRRIDDMQPDSSDLDLSAAAEPGPQADEYSEVPDQTDGLASMPATNTPSLPRNVATGRSFVGMVIAAGKDDAKSSACRSGSGTPCIGTAGTYKKLGQGDMLHGGWLDVAIARRGSSEIIWGGELKLATTLSLEHLIGLQSVVESEGGLQMIATGWTVGDDPSTLPKALDLRVEFTAQQCSNEQPLSVSVMPVLCQVSSRLVKLTTDLSRDGHEPLSSCVPLHL